MTEIAECKYYLPCGLCELSHERCKQLNVVHEPVECNHDYDLVTMKANDSYLELTFRCRNCGRTKTEKFNDYGM